jgi:HSP20 family protein
MNYPWNKRNFYADRVLNTLNTLLSDTTSSYAYDYQRDQPVNDTKRTPWGPGLELRESKEEYNLFVELPGIPENCISVDLHDNILEISGERKNEITDTSAGRFYSERVYGHFYRKVPFEKEVDPEQIKATLNHGILSIKVAKKANNPRSAKNIQITT